MNYLDLFSLKGKTAFVTGACGLIGEEISIALATAGATTILLDVNDAKGSEISNRLTENGYSCEFEYFDVTDLGTIESKCKQLVAKYNRADIWINSAYPRTEDWGSSVEELSLSSFQKNVDMNLSSTAWLNKVVALLMSPQLSGSIVNMGSIYGVVGNDFTLYEGTDVSGPMPYPVIKGGITNLTRYMASYFGKHNIRFNTVCPGGVYNGHDSNFVERYSKRTPLGRMAKPEEIASATLFLASEASSYVSGATLMVDGGWTAI